VPLRCLLVDDNSAFLQAASTLLERQGMTVVGVVSTGAEAVQRTVELRPDVVLVDIVLGTESGFDVARELAGRDSGRPAVILISTHAEADFSDLIDGTPAAGFVAKSELSADAIQRLVNSSPGT
jgi:DNA-binding NarL/FixJ family response regulator